MCDIAGTVDWPNQSKKKQKKKKQTCPDTTILQRKREGEREIYLGHQVTPVRLITETQVHVITLTSPSSQDKEGENRQSMYFLCIFPTQQKPTKEETKVRENNS